MKHSLNFKLWLVVIRLGSLWTHKAKLLANIPLLPTFVIKAFQIKD